MEGRDVAALMKGLTVEGITDEDNLVKALRQVKKGTVLAEDGFPTEFYAAKELREEMVPHLARLLRETLSKEDMTEAMKEACITVLYKGRGKDPTMLKSYRPISITPASYRILTKAI